jgi:hypothetical protein
MSKIDSAEIDHRFDYVSPTPEKQVVHEGTLEAYKALAWEIAAWLPESREKSLAITALEESLMWANAAIARNPLPTTD